MIEKWYYFFKYAPSIREEEVTKIIDSDLAIQGAYKALNRFNWSEKELLAYEKEIKPIMDNQAVEDYMKEKAKQEGERMGMEKGKQEGKIEIAKAMLKKGYSKEDIVIPTGLPLSQIKEFS